jgi:hypothetical protein
MATGQSSYSGNDGTVYFDLTTDTGDRAEINNALFFQNKPDTSSGTGLIQAIVRVQDPGNGDGFENGYNTSFRPLSYEENTSPNFTTSLLLAEVPKVTIDGTQYYEFRLDINQLNSSSLLSLDEIKLYTSAVADGLASGTVGGAWFAANADLVYDMDGAGNTSVLLDAGNSSGSGSSDMFFYVPVSNFGAVDPDDTYVTLYSEFGGATVLDASDGLTPLDDPANTALGDNGDDTGDVSTAVYGTYTANDGFEEWSVSKQTGGLISGYKFADVNGDGQWNVGEGGLGGWTIDYTISYDEGKGHNSQHVVVTGSATTSDGTVDVDGDGIIDPLGFYSIPVPLSSDKNESYTITLTEESKAGYVNTYDGDATANSTTTFTFSGNDLTQTGTPASPNISGHFGVTESMNFGNFNTIDLSGTKYLDVTGNGITADDSGLGGFTVFIDLNNNGINDEAAGYVTTTLADGSWSFTGLGPEVIGHKVLEVQQSGYTQTVGTAGYTVTADATGLDFANFNQIDLSGTKYLDVTGNGITADDSGLGGFTVFVDLNDNGINDEAAGYVTTTLADGSWSFTGLGPEVIGHKVLEVQQSGYTQTVGTAGYTVTADATGLDFANFNQIDLSGTKYLDVTGDGITADDSGLGGFTVFIDLNNNGINDEAAGYVTTTLADGTWSFTGLGPEVIGHKVLEVQQSGYVQTVGTAGYTVTADATDLDFANFLANPSIDVEKSVKTNLFDFLPEDGDDDPNGLLAATNSLVTFKVVVTNTGNETLSGITLTDSVVHTVNGVPTSQDIVYTPDGNPATLDAFNVFVDLNNNTLQDAGEAWANFDTDGDGIIDAGAIAELSPNETFTLYYNLNSLLGQHENTGNVEAVSAISNTTVSDADDANYYVLEENCVGVRTPGFWSNWGGFWDGVSNNQPKQQGQPGFAAGELIYAVDSDGNGVVNPLDTNGDGFINGAPKDGVNDTKPLDTSVGLLVGDYNMNGITDAGEDTIFISLADAKTLINASNKQLVDGKTADGIYMLGRDVVAAWLNYLANNHDTTGNCVGTVDSGDGTNTPREFLDAAIDWLQQFASTSNSDDTPSTTDTNLNTSFHDGNLWAKFEFDARVAPASDAWQKPFTTGEDIPVSAAAMHSAIDSFNNTGTINGVEYCCDADNHLALLAISQVALV